VPESEESEQSYGTVKMQGVLYGVILTGTDPDTAVDSLNRLLHGQARRVGIVPDETSEVCVAHN
jgi:hypothetical protein